MTWCVTTEQSWMFRRRQNRVYSRSIHRMNILQTNIRRIIMSRIAYGQDDYLDDENQYPNDMSVSGYDIQEDDTLD